MTSLHNPPRSGQLFATITDAAGITGRCRLAPDRPGPGELAAFRLVKLDQLGREQARHRVALLNTGATACTYPAGAAGAACKHADFLGAAGLFPVGLLRQLRELVEDLEGRQRQLAAVVPEARAAALRPRRRRAA